MSDLRTLMREAVGLDGQDEVCVVMCEVESVNEEARTCSVTTVSDKTETELGTVALMAEANDGFLIIPKVGSVVAVCKTLQLTPFVVMFSEIEKIVMVVGETGVEITDGLIQFNDGSFGGLVKIEELVDKINRLESKVDDLISKYNGHTHPYVDSGAPAVTSVTGTQETPIGTQTTVSDLENPNITHGESL
jgi:hypothetical protein